MFPSFPTAVLLPLSSFRPMNHNDNDLCALFRHVRSMSAVVSCRVLSSICVEVHFISLRGGAGGGLEYGMRVRVSSVTTRFVSPKKSWN